MKVRRKLAAMEGLNARVKEILCHLDLVRSGAIDLVSSGAILIL
jgi:hypothetical protein